jgi:Phage integrase family
MIRYWQAGKVAAGINEVVSPHWLRHAHGSHAIERGASLPEVQATLGHGNIATTSGHMHARPDSSSGLRLDRRGTPLGSRARQESAGTVRYSIPSKLDASHVNGPAIEAGQSISAYPPMPVKLQSLGFTRSFTAMRAIASHPDATQMQAMTPAMMTPYFTCVTTPACPVRTCCPTSH